MRIILILFIIGLTLVKNSSVMHAQNISTHQLEQAQQALLSGQLLLRKKNYRQALKAFKRSYDFAPDIKVLMTIGAIYKKLDQCSDGYNIWLKAYSLCNQCDLKDLINKQWRSSTYNCSRAVSLKSIPNASIRMNGKMIGRTPMSIPLLFGSHYLEVSSRAHITKQVSLLVEAKQREHKYKFILEPQMGSIVVTSNAWPSGSQKMPYPADPNQLSLNTLDTTNQLHSQGSHTWWEGIKTKGSQTRKTTRTWLWVGTALFVGTASVFTGLFLEDKAKMQDKVNRFQVRSYQVANSGAYIKYHKFAVGFGLLGALTFSGASTLWLLDR
jgi:hypothetical protein